LKLSAADGLWNTPTFPLERECTCFSIAGTKGCIKLKTLFGFGNDRLWGKDSLILEESNSGVMVIPLDAGNNSRTAFYKMEEYFIKGIKGQNANFVTCREVLKTVGLINRIKLKKIAMR